MPKVSVIMSIYKEPLDWIRQSIDSILNQTFTDFEFIVVNDNPDSPKNIKLLQDYSQLDKRIVPLFNKENIGLTKSLNRALEVASGIYIARMDADDISLPTRFERQVKFLDENKRIFVVGSWTGQIDECGKIINVNVRYETQPKWIRALFLHNSQVAHPSAMYHRIVNDEQVKYNESVKYAQDYSLWAHFLHYGDIANLPEILFYYRISNQRITSKKQNEQQDCACVAQKIMFNLYGLNVTELFLDIFSCLTIRHIQDFPDRKVVSVFRDFFKSNHITIGNCFALENILGIYLSFLKRNSQNKWTSYMRQTLKNNSCPMNFLWAKYMFDISIHKVCRMMRH